MSRRSLVLLALVSLFVLPRPVVAQIQPVPSGGNLTAGSAPLIEASSRPVLRFDWLSRLIARRPAPSVHPVLTSGVRHQLRAGGRAISPVRR
jgi:hypothetical protein